MSSASFTMLEMLFAVPLVTYSYYSWYTVNLASHNDQNHWPYKHGSMRDAYLVTDGHQKTDTAWRLGQIGLQGPPEKV